MEAYIPLHENLTLYLKFIGFYDKCSTKMENTVNLLKRLVLGGEFKF
jgi:hypothetical protein